MFLTLDSALPTQQMMSLSHWFYLHFLALPLTKGEKLKLYLLESLKVFISRALSLLVASLSYFFHICIYYYLNNMFEIRYNFKCIKEITETLLQRQISSVKLKMSGKGNYFAKLSAIQDLLRAH